ncbi:Protein of uncharacterised function (DUF2637) [Mycobacteroides abscessus subsp. abscessus]|uniref:Protein of uncharacterized function (DUF2637) n=2 Tax=Mycobacteroides abscessus TaxID=36809 RepID=A0AB38D7Q7_9MYCO|nr:Protein of uncharacterised function (DUF2637) [Mycobacteroides abscessus subsp. abscessus]SIC25133.1 Protein of uncharacterised function (DUF2637) [Mycobacteroides abscessus subsp. abscessus]SIC26080.1 Protein of uncharacterised function (DUF2637) [Mycobacteroides abscessus subsp. abscessus]SIC40567.1 Protein of uncharacterised function (DUF2637) [Mycobacteroides abscessus subsp. abscessus]SIF77835.1 Protein of uncharacterised function (DUF2637) [Mycobacteroides abscessus subsp. abscessus]
MSTLTDRAEHDIERSRAHQFFWRWLIGATALTLLGNAAHALLDYIPTTLVRLAVYLIPPLVALVSIHAVTVLARVGRVHRARSSASWRDAGGTAVLAVSVTAALALIAAVLSYSGLYGVALAGGLSPRLAWLFPLCIDAGIAVSSVALVVLRPLSGADERAARMAHRAAQPQVSNRPTPPTAPRPTPSSAPTAAPSASRSPSPAAPAAPRPAPSSAPQGSPTAPTPAPELVRLAERIVSSKAVRQPVKVVARILELAESESRKNVISERVGVHHSVVSKVLEAAEYERRSQLQAVS